MTPVHIKILKDVIFYSQNMKVNCGIVTVTIFIKIYTCDIHEHTQGIK